MIVQTQAEFPYALGAGAWYPLTTKLEKQYTLKDRFGEPYELFERKPFENGILLPRRAAPYISLNDLHDMGIQDRTSLGPKAYDWDDGFIPRSDEQIRVAEESSRLLVEGGYYGGHIVQAPTGWGKTYVGSSIIQRIGVRSCVITTKEDILDDWKIALSKTLNIDLDQVGEWRGDKVPEKHHHAVVALVQSVCKGYERYDQSLYEGFGLVMVDEVQRMGADEFSKAMWHFPAVYRIGLSATPYRKDGKETVFQSHIGTVDVITEEVNLTPKVIMVDTEWEVPEVWQYDAELGKSVFGPLELDWGRVSTVVKHLQDDKRRNKTVVNFLKACVGKGRNIIVFSDNVDHLKIMKQACVDAGLSDTDNMFGYYCGLQAEVYEKGELTKKEQREKAKVARIIFATYKMASEATNIPWLDTAILTTPKADVVQPVGRILREWEGKQDPLVLDLCDFNHRVLATFAQSRTKWYARIGAEIVRM